MVHLSNFLIELFLNPRCFILVVFCAVVYLLGFLSSHGIIRQRARVQQIDLLIVRENARAIRSGLSFCHVIHHTLLHLLPILMRAPLLTDFLLPGIATIYIG